MAHPSSSEPKCTASVRARGYDIQPIYTDQTRKAPYTIDDIDVLFAHIIPLDIWYVLPVEAFAPAKASASTPRDANAPASNNTAKPGTSCARKRKPPPKAPSSKKS